MRGIPQRINTRHDLEILIQLAQEGKVDRTELRKKLESILAAGQVYVFDKVLSSPDAADGTEPDYRILQVEKEDGTVEYHQYKLSEDPGALYLRWGFTRDEFLSLIQNL